MIFNSSVRTKPVDVNDITLITFVTKLLSLCLSSVWRTLYIHNQIVVAFDNTKQKDLGPFVNILL